MTIGFKLISEDGDARLGEITTSHGIIDTPAFMPVGTYGAVKNAFTKIFIGHRCPNHSV